MLVLSSSARLEKQEKFCFAIMDSLLINNIDLPEKERKIVLSLIVGCPDFWFVVGIWVGFVTIKTDFF